MTIAVSHPGKIGDALYSLPTVRYLCELHGTRADFYTSSYCEPLRRLLEAQDCIERVIVPEDYKIENGFQGIQPWNMPIPEAGYERVYQLGFQAEPDRPLPDYIASTVGAPSGLPIAYHYQEQPTLDRPYLVLAPGKDLRYRRLFSELIALSPIDVAVIGTKDEFFGAGLDCTGLDILDTLPWIANSSGFIGCMSSPLVLANGFPIHKVVVDDGSTWDMRHVVRSPFNHYPINPSPLAVLFQLGVISFSKALHPKDYLWIGEIAQIKEAAKRLQGVPFRIEHEHRAWEYGLGLRALRTNGAQTVLDVGGGGSLFAPAAALAGMNVVQVDPAACGGWVEQQRSRWNLNLSYFELDFFQFQSLERFDAVTCISVIEHVVDDLKFFDRLLSFVNIGGLLYLTTDFHPSGGKQVDGHLRTYTAEKLRALADRARIKGFLPFVSDPVYSSTGEHVNNYNFASLVLRRQNWGR